MKYTSIITAFFITTFTVLGQKSQGTDTTERISNNSTSNLSQKTGSVKREDFAIPDDQDRTTEGLKKLEPFIIKAAIWLEQTPCGSEQAKSSKVCAFVLKWLIDTKAVSFRLDEPTSSVFSLFTDNNDFVGVFLSGYARYSLEHNYSSDKLKMCTAGVKSVIACYRLGGPINENKDLLAAIEADKQDRLEQFIKKKNGLLTFPM